MSEVNHVKCDECGRTVLKPAALRSWWAVTKGADFFYVQTQGAEKTAQRYDVCSADCVLAMLKKFMAQE